ncbi:hypothetical protein P4O66_001198 [Electrophorus voltai]|uniref:Reverse transcriptase RNase H-like domain-containing protein n=1 Tax=Electrophorus voltai TaxID=2609070 RepID=A0AAD8ZDF9_9TELE|nr:hypothetical protein P4O66_001198 [Electrophorus voltai]
MEVDASDTGVTAVLSQHTGDCELLAMKLAFEEWRHWLKGVRHPFMVYTDHKNLEYLQTTKRLNARQALCSDLLQAQVLHNLQAWGEKHQGGQAVSATPCRSPTDECGACSPPRASWCPCSGTTDHLCTAETSGCSDCMGTCLCRNGTPWCHTYSTVNRHLLLVACYAQGCGERPHVFPLSVKLHPLPTPLRPWSHLAVDFVTLGLPHFGTEARDAGSPRCGAQSLDQPAATPGDGRGPGVQGEKPARLPEERQGVAIPRGLGGVQP